LRPTELAADYFSTMGSMMENASTTAD